MGTRTRNRVCSNGVPGANGCEGAATEMSECQGPVCSGNTKNRYFVFAKMLKYTDVVCL